MYHRWWPCFLNHSNWRCMHNLGHCVRMTIVVMSLRRIRMRLPIHVNRDLIPSWFLDYHHRRGDIIRLLRWNIIRRRLRLRRRSIFNHLIKIINPQPNLSPNPTKHTLLLQRKINQPFVPTLRELGTVELNTTQEMILPSCSSGVAVLLIIVDLDLKLLIFHVLWV
uniref:Uncharacterized protein n=1 Tax=Cannabis sativa TaxID=3483 RepID=A0A803QYK2_CANSA